MSIGDLTIKEIKEVAQLFGVKSDQLGSRMKNKFVGEYVIIRTYSAGNWAGILKEKDGNEVILTKARRLWRWWAAKSITLSGVAKYGINQDKSRIAGELDHVWLEAIEIIPVMDIARESIESCIEAAQDND